MKPLYIWAGGKGKMIPKYMSLPGIPYSGYDTYVEPFFGGGAMMAHIASRNTTVKKYIINDINTEIINLYTEIKNNIDVFISHLNQLQATYLNFDKPNRKIFYYSIRDEYTTKWQKWSKTEEAATLYFLMKTGFNGIWQVNKKSNGRFATPCGLLDHTTHIYDVDNLLEWHTFLQKAEICSGNWDTCLSYVEGKAFFFFDPPYRDSFTQYGQTFTEQDHVDLINYCKVADTQGHLVMYCNRLANVGNDSGDTFYTDHRGELCLSDYNVTYTAGRRSKNKDTGVHEAKKATEILLYNKAIVNMKCNTQKKHPSKQLTELVRDAFDGL